MDERPKDVCAIMYNRGKIEVVDIKDAPAGIVYGIKSWDYKGSGPLPYGQRLRDFERGNKKMLITIIPGEKEVVERLIDSLRDVMQPIY